MQYAAQTFSALLRIEDFRPSSLRKFGNIEQLVDKLVFGSTELRHETSLRVLGSCANPCYRAVQDGVLHISPLILGTWAGELHHFDPTAFAVGTCRLQMITRFSNETESLNEPRTI